MVLKAEGDTERFLNLLAQKKIQGDSARKMIYFETITAVMKTVGVKKIMVRDKNEDNPARLILNSNDD